jgi:membrane-bound lytic murein transglycosylase B
MKKNSVKKLLICSLFALGIVKAQASSQTWSEFVRQLRSEAIAQGVRPQVFDSAFQGVHEPNRQIIHLDNTQPEKRITYLKYRSTRADAYRIKLGRREFKNNQQLLESIGNRFGVSPCFVVSIWGMETSYGRYMGTFPVIKSLATLAYDGRRSSFFRSELLLALHILNDNQVNLRNFKGEWAGASGHPQFLPSTWHNFAVDYNNDGKKDIWQNLDDGLASIANYLAKNGWKTEQPWAIAVSLPPNFNHSQTGLNITKTVQEWKSLGIQPQEGTLPAGDLLASIIEPDGGPDYMVFNNFKMLMKWNHSIYYAGTIGYMAEQICQRKL